MPRPLPTFEGFIGQRELVLLLNAMIAGAHKTGQPLPCMLFEGPAGCGKNRLAESVVSAYGSRCRYVQASGRVKREDLHRQIGELDSCDFLFIDEIHALPRDSQEALYSVLDGWKIAGQTSQRRPNSEGVAVGVGEAPTVSVAEFTLIVATNEPGKIKNALKNRLLSLTFKRYSETELKAIAEAYARELNIELTPQAANLLANTCQGSPREIRIRTSSLTLFSAGKDRFGKTDVRSFLSHLGIDARSLTTLQREYLKVLSESPRGSSTVSRVSIRLGVDTARVREIEIYLIEQEYITDTPSIRSLTDKGRKTVCELA